MPHITAVGTAVPPYRLEQAQAKEFARALFGAALPSIDRLVEAYDNAQIVTRNFCAPIDWFAERHTFREKNDLYIANAIALSEEAIALCLERAGLRHEDIDDIIFVSTTGLATPSIDARLIERLPFRRDIRRLPVWGLGCAGGVAAIARAADIATARPHARVLAVVVELCGLTFVPNDLSKGNLIASALFGDGAAAVLIEGDAVGADGPRVVGSATRTLPDSLDVMGWSISEEGFGIVISRDIPTIVRTFMRESIDHLLGTHDVPLDRVRHLIAHPGGAKVLEAYQESLDRTPDDFRHTWDVLREYGNMSAASVLFVLERFLGEREKGEGKREGSRVGMPLEASSGYKGEYALIGALGPGFSSELVLVEWG